MTDIIDVGLPRSESNHGMVDYQQVAKDILEALQWVSMSSYERDVLREDMRYWKDLLRP